MKVDITNIPFKMTLGEAFFNELGDEIKNEKVDTIYSFDYKKGLQNLAVFAKDGNFKNRVEIIIKTRMGNEIRIFFKIFLENQETLYIKIVDPKEHEALRTAFLNGTEKRIDHTKSLIRKILS